MSFLPANAQQSYVPPSVILPEDPTQLRNVLTEKLQRIIDALNSKTIGQFELSEILSGQLLFTPGNSSKYRHIFRKLIDFGPLPNTTTISIPHGITWNTNTRFTHIYGTATTPSTDAIPLPYGDPSQNTFEIRLHVDPTNVLIEAKRNYSAYTTTYVVLEYVQQA